MTVLETRTCGRCGATADQVPIGVLVSEPAGWTYVVIGGLPECHKRVCPACARAVRDFLATTPAERATAWRSGYEEGCNDSEASHVCVCPPPGWFVQHETRQLIWAPQIDLADEPVTPLSEWLVLQHTGAGS